jgi:hypothetical protein
MDTLAIRCSSSSPSLSSSFTAFLSPSPFFQHPSSFMPVILFLVLFVFHDGIELYEYL